MRRSRSAGRRPCTPADRASRRRPTTSARSTRRHRAGARRGPPRSARCRRAARRLAHRGVPHGRAAEADGSRRDRRSSIAGARTSPTRGADGWLDRLPGSRAVESAARDRGSQPNGCPNSWPCTRTRRSRRSHGTRVTRARACGPASTAIVELVRGRLTITGPTTATPSPPRWRSTAEDAAAALHRARIGGRRPARIASPPASDAARMVRSAAARAHPSLHAEPLARGNRSGQSGRFHAIPLCVAARRAGSRLTGVDGLRSVIGTLDGFELAASAWERAVLPARVERYQPSMLDMLCLAGDVGWARLSPRRRPKRRRRAG